MRFPVAFRRSLPLAVLALTTACVDTLEIPNARYGVVSVVTYQDDLAGTVMAPEATFYDRTDLRITPPAADSCNFAAYTPTQNVNTNSFTLGAGDYLLSTIGARTDTLRPYFVGNLAIYRPPTGRTIPFTPGDTFSLVVPGAEDGFPAITSNIRTAEAFTHAPVEPPAEGQPLQLSWTAAPQPGSLMTFSLRYANAFSLDGTPNEQVFCGFTDDGSGTIRPEFLEFWRNAPATSRSVRVIRLRVKEVQIDSRTRLAFVSTYGVPLYPLQ
ncbi:MAG: hypothetical protein RLZZ467_550 [Gemmatimonadota bacterium]|jgi:hypothetical protein